MLYSFVLAFSGGGKIDVTIECWKSVGFYVSSAHVSARFSVEVKATRGDAVTNAVPLDRSI